ncbi:hypothetical protein ACI2K4_05030 [Micromonospora sp. NPDC050397]|uniref:hypothetical protein n=1 Tax=Micromonospora sp. NPDC050397 TaxID=3364279 RepID=UPI00384E4D01
MTEATATPTDRSWFRRPLTVGVAAVLVVGLAVWAGVTLLGGNDRVIRMEVTSSTGEVEGITWRSPDDNNENHTLSGDETPIKSPWSQDVEVAAKTGPILLNALAPLGGTATCRLLVGDEVLHEDTGSPFANCMVTAQRAFPAS